MSLDVISRAAWGARYAAGVGPRAIPTAEAWLHHTVTLAPDLAFSDLNADSVDDDEVRAMRTIEAIGQQRFGHGFSYNLAVMPSGRIYVGCGVRRVGSHTSKRNTKALGVVLVGNYEASKPSTQMIASVTAVLREGHALGWIDRPAFDGGHRDLRDTSCPGRFAYALIPSINRAAARPAPSSAPGPKPSAPVLIAPPSTVQETSMARLFLDPDGETVYAVTGTGMAHVPDEVALARGRRLGYYPNVRPTPISAADLGALSEQFGFRVDDAGAPAEALPAPADPET